VGGKNVEIQPRARVCKILEIADADDVGHSSCRTFGARPSLPVERPTNRRGGLECASVGDAIVIRPEEKKAA